MRQSKAEDRIAAFVEAEMAEADGARTDELTQKRKKALDYYAGAARGDEVEGRSQVVSLELAAAVNNTLALMKGMLIDEASVSFEAYGPEDEQLAKAEGDICSDVLYKDNMGELVLMNSIKDGLLSAQSIVAVDVEEEGDQNNITVRSVPSENVCYQAAYQGDLQDIRFFCEMVPYSRTDLRKMGIKSKLVDKLSPGGEDHWNSASQARNAQGYATNQMAGEREEDVISCYWCYVLMDLDGDGEAERHRVLYSCATVLMHEPFEVVPYALGNPFITPHRLQGESLYDRLKQVQDTATALQRQLIDNVATMNNGRVAYDPSRVSEDDVLNPVAGGGIRARDPGSSIMPLMVPDASTGILTALEFQRRKRSEIAGGSLEMTDAGAQLMNKSATQASIDKSNSELITTLIAHTLSHTMLRPLFKLIRYHLRTYATRPYIARVSGQAVPVNPLEWPADRRIIVSAGKSPGEKAQEAQALGMHLQNSVMAMNQGMSGVLADAQTIYRTSLRFLQLNGVQDAESLQIDPSSPQAQQAQQQSAQAAQAQQQQQQQMIQQQIQLAMADLAEKARQHDGDLEHKYYDTDMDAAVAEAKLVGQGAIDLEKERQRVTNANGQAEGAADGGAASAGGAA